MTPPPVQPRNDINDAVLSLVYVRRQRATARIRPPTPLSAGRAAVQQSIDISCPPGPRRVCCCGPVLGQTDREADGPTDNVALHRPAAPTVRAVSVLTVDGEVVEHARTERRTRQKRNASAAHSMTGEQS